MAESVGYSYVLATLRGRALNIVVVNSSFFAANLLALLIPLLLAESVGFEPTGPYDPTVFKTAAFDHSANSPRLSLGNIQIKSKVWKNSLTKNLFYFILKL